MRAVWLALVYKTLRNINFPGGSTTSDMPPDRLDAFVKDVVVAVRRGYDMKRIQLEQLSVGEPRTDLESAVLGQSTRLVVTTISAADSALQNDDL